MLSPGKAFTDPLLLILVVSIVCIAIALRRVRNDRTARRALLVALAALLVLAALSTGFVAALLEHSLTVESDRNEVPDVIVIASGGSEGHAPTRATMNRVVAGVAWWKEHPRARLVMAGVDSLGRGITSMRTLHIMRDTAIRLGVPPDRIELEAKSTNTREHPLRLRELRGITRSTRVGVVTSGWHLRRTRGAFRRSFPHVITRAADRPGDPYWIVNDVIPSANDLEDSKLMLQEWIGIAWYALRG